ncbi:MAG: transcriptional repressor [Verrucomicrobia bacterium]|nr:transcriptional repressor [Verrucomicrobiota bacterium]
MRPSPPTRLPGERLTRCLAQTGYRFTPQRQHVYAVLLAKRDHPTAEQVFLRAKRAMPEISMATVYNCLDTLVKCGLVREVNLERAATRYCPNMQEHLHFYCEACGQVFDIDLKADGRASGFHLPPGFRPARFHVSVRGACPRCADRTSRPPRAPDR